MRVRVVAGSGSGVVVLWSMWARSVSLVRSALGGGSDCRGPMVVRREKFATCPRSHPTRRMDPRPARPVMMIWGKKFANLKVWPSPKLWPHSHLSSHLQLPARTLVGTHTGWASVYLCMRSTDDVPTDRDPTYVRPRATSATCDHLRLHTLTRLRDPHDLHAKHRISNCAVRFLVYSVVSTTTSMILRV